MPSYQDRFLNKENFYLAFKKLRQYLDQANEWYNQVELEAYEAQLPSKIFRLLEEIENRTYRPKEIQPLPFPKKNKEDAKEMRPYFRVSLDDQLIWIAIINVIGEAVESKLPFWNYGNRLYRPLWYENDEKGVKKLQKGGFANSSSWFYRKWNQSWPLYRRHVSIAIKVMAHNANFSTEDLSDEKEQLLFEENELQNVDKVSYFDKNFWPKGQLGKLYWAGTDFTRFFPSVDTDLVMLNMRSLLAERNDVALILDLAEKMLTFPISLPWDDKYFMDEYRLQQAGTFTGLPTGLYAAGFLANLSLYEVDRRLHLWINEKRQIALFKYVDDQVILSNSPEALLEFLNFYQDLLKEKAEQIKFQPLKLAPTGVFGNDVDGKFTYLSDKPDHLGNELDIQYPEPLMTHTLKKMSDLNGEDFNLSDGEDLDKAQDDLEHFLIADFTETEMRRDTRMSFAAMKLCRLAKRIRPNFSNLDFSLHTNKEIILNELSDQLKTISEEKEQRKLINDTIFEHFQTRFRVELQKVSKKYRRIFSLLIKACKENPDKVKLWKRTVEFCSYTGYDGIQDIFDTADLVEVHGESKVYIKSYCVLILQESMLQTNNSITGQSSSFWRSYTAWAFIKNIQAVSGYFSEMAKSFHDYPFVQETFFNFEVVSGLVFQTLQTLPEELKIVNDVNTVTDNSLIFIGPGQIDKTRFDLTYFSRFEHHFWFLLNRTNKDVQYNLWIKNINGMNWEHPISWSIISLYPRSIPFPVFSSMPRSVNESIPVEIRLSERYNFLNGSGFMYDIFDSNPEIRSAYLSEYTNLQYAFDPQRKEQNLLEWFNSVQEETSKERWTDPRLSEWTMLEIISQIAEAYSEKINDKLQVIIRGLNLSCFHPANFIISSNWKVQRSKLTWESWRRKIRAKDARITIVNDSDLIDDFRYFPSEKNWQSKFYWLFGTREEDIIVCLTVLLVQLTARSFQWPSAASKRMFIDQLFSTALHAIESESLSSDTRLLVGAILSRKEAGLYYGEQPVQLSEGRSLRTLKDFKAELAKIQKKLEKYQFSMRDKMPRQLTMIDIDAMNTQPDKFFQLHHD